MGKGWRENGERGNQGEEGSRLAARKLAEILEGISGNFGKGSKMKKWSKEWVESIIQLLNDPFGDYDRMRKELKNGIFWDRKERSPKCVNGEMTFW